MRVKQVSYRESRGAPLVLAALIAPLTVACATTPPSLSTQAAAESAKYDDLVASAVTAALNADPKYYFRHVDVQVVNGVADLSGYVWSTDAIYRARALASTTPGVTGVVTSQLQLERNGRDTSIAR